jgi:hypothetical protein
MARRWRSSRVEQYRQPACPIPALQVGVGRCRSCHLRIQGRHTEQRRTRLAPRVWPRQSPGRGAGVRLPAKSRAASRPVPPVAHRRVRRRAGLRHGATLRPDGAAHRRPRAALTPSARCAEPARRACRRRTRGPGQQARLLRVDRTARTNGLLQMRQQSLPRNGPPGGPGDDAVARVLGPMTRRFAQVTG